MSEAVQKLFTEISPTYDKLNHVLSLNIDKSWRKQTIGTINKERHATFTALDLCAGTHDLGLECLTQFPKSKIIAADFSFGMLASGQHKIAGKAITPVCADGLNLPFADQSFDVVFCGFGMRNLDDKTRGLSEIHRVLKPDGQILILEFFKPDSFLSRVFNKTYAEHILPRIGKLISGNQAAYEYLRDSIRGFLTTSEFSQLMSQTGFHHVNTQDFVFGIASCVSGTK